MAFCKQCGTDLNGANFCPKCGAQTDGVVVVQPQQPVVQTAASARSMANTEIMNLKQYFGAKAQQYNMVDVVENNIEQLKAKSFGGYIVGGVIAAILSIWLIGNVPGFLIGIAAFVGSIFLKKSFVKKNNASLAQAEQQLNDLNAELAEYYFAYGDCPIGFEYTTPGALDLIANQIRSGRACTIPDAINLCLDDLHKQQMVSLAEETKAAAIAAAEASQDAKKASTASAIFSAANFFKD